MAIRRTDDGATREMSIPFHAPSARGFLIGAAARDADAGVGRVRRSLTHLGVRSLLCSPTAFASTPLVADPQFTMPI